MEIGELQDMNRETFMIDFELGRRLFVKMECTPEIPQRDVKEWYLYQRYLDFSNQKLILIRNHLNREILEFINQKLRGKK